METEAQEGGTGSTLTMFAEAEQVGSQVGSQEKSFFFFSSRH